MILDTNALSAFADEQKGVLVHIGNAEQLCVPAIVLGEYRFGIATSRHRRAYEAWLRRGRAYWRVLPVDEATSDHYAEVRNELKKAGTPLPANDVWIAALARQHGLPILSRDAHFDFVRDARRLTWDVT